jgi:pimeloyl-ACP methyl ester carboxylesterase
VSALFNYRAWADDGSGGALLRPISRLLLMLALLIPIDPLLAANTGITRTISDGDVSIETFIYGEGRDTLIIAAGNGRPAAQLEELASNIAASGIQVVTYNYRGIGDSKGQIDDITLLDLAQDVWRIADAMGLTTVHLAGKTYGNRVMRAAAADKPARTLSITLIGAGGEILPSEEIQAKYWRYVDPATSRKEWQALQAELMFAAGNEHLASRSNALGSYPELAAAQIKASNATPKGEWAHGGTAPMLVLTCLDDQIAVPENALSLAKSRPNTWMVGIPGCGHNMIYERPEALSRLIVDYITQHTTAGHQGKDEEVTSER